MLLFCEPGWAAPQTQQRAAQVVAGWLAASPRPLRLAVSASARAAQVAADSTGQPLYYVFPLDPAGFVVVSGDDTVEPILAFSANGDFDLAMQGPLPALLARDVAERVIPTRSKVKAAAAVLNSASVKWADLGSSNPQPRNSGVSTPDDIRVSPFIQSRWNQSSIWGGSSSVACYNYYTPPYASGASSNYVCGCNNTAWAQIMRYYNYPTQSVGTASYTISIDGVNTSRPLRGGDGLGGPYQWSQMTLVPGSTTTLQQRQAIGALTADIGVAAETDYAAGGSGAYLLGSVLKNVFHYANAMTASGIGAQFTDQVLPNLDARLPVYLSIYGTGGHAIVCDGYGYNLGTLYHHLNLGWGGYEDAWYNLPNISAGGYTFTSVGGFFYNIFPVGGGEIISGRVLDTTNAPIPFATVQAVGGGHTYSVQSDSRGIYALAQLPSSTSYSLTVTKNGYQFPPRTVATGVSQDYSGTGNKSGINFIGSLDANARVVTGTITSADGSGIAGVTVSFSNSGGTVITDATGIYFNTVPVGWTGTITPSKTRYVFTPGPIACSNVVANLGNLDFRGALVVYVNSLASGLNDGSSWANAFISLQSALAQAASGNEIWVAQGTYRPGTARTNAFQCKSGVSLLGGFVGSETDRAQRDWATYATVLSGDIGTVGDVSDNTYHVVLGAAQALLDGFTVTGGNANRSGVWLDDLGGGIGGAYGLSGFTVANCRITGNCASNYAGGVYSANVINSIICSNAAQYGGAAYQGTLKNCLIISNTATWYGGATYLTTNLSCTIVSNRTHYGGGCYGGAATNCIIIYNSADYGGSNYYSTVVLDHCCALPLADGTGNQTAAPLFQNPAGGDYRLSLQSTLINAGSNQDWMTNGLDLAGQPRIANGLVDLGAYESALTQPRLSCNPGGIAFVVMAGAPATNQALQVWNSGVGTLNYSSATTNSWLLISPPTGSSAGETEALTATVNAVGLAPGNYAGQLTICSTNAMQAQLPVPVSLTVVPDYNVPLNTHGFSWTSAGNSAWTVQTTVTHDGVDALRSGVIADSQNSALQTTFNGPGVVSFWCKVSSETNYDFLKFFIGTNELMRLSGEVNWQSKTFDVPAGLQTLLWQYGKDSVTSGGQDAAWLDQVLLLGPPVLVTPSRIGNAFAATIPTASGKNYFLEYKNNLSDTNWTALPGVAGNGNPQTLTDPAAGTPQRYYRIRQQ